MRRAATCCSTPSRPTTSGAGTCCRLSNWRRRWAARAARSGPSSRAGSPATDLYRAILEGEPYPIKGMVSFGTNILVSHADTGRGAAALKALDFAVHVDMFMTPSAALADIVLPVNTPFEREGLCTNFSVGADATSFAAAASPAVNRWVNRRATSGSPSNWPAPRPRQSVLGRRHRCVVPGDA